MKEKDFPMLKKDNIYLDSACMSLKPKQVIQKINQYYKEYTACTGRSSHQPSQKATKKLKKARKNVARLIDAKKDDIIFTSGTTEAINTVAQGFNYNKAVITDKEHNSNRVPWQKHSEDVKEIKTTKKGINLEELKNKVEKNDIVSLTHRSNIDGQEINVRKVAEKVHDQNAYLMVDAAQSVPHQPFSTKKIGADFVAFSGHKMLGPTGTGALYVDEKHKDNLEPLKYGGGAVKNMKNRQPVFQKFPQKFEAGLQNIAGFTGFGEAASYLDKIGLNKIRKHEKKLTKKALRELEGLEGLQIYNEGGGVISMNFRSLSSQEAARLLDKRSIFVRAGAHCVHPWFEDKKIDSTVRASLYLYNNEQDINEFTESVSRLSKI